MKSIIYSILFLFINAALIFSQPLLIENFDYPNGTPVTSNGWTLFSGTENPINVSSPGLTYSGYPFSGIGNAATMTSTGQDVYRNLSSVKTTGTVYASFMVHVTSAFRPGDYFAAFLPSNSTTFFAGRVFARLNGSSLDFGLTKASQSDTNSMMWIPGYSLNTTYIIVLKYTFVPGTQNDLVSMHIFQSGMPIIEPPSIIPPMSFNTTSNDANNIGRFALRQGTNNRAPGLKIDGILVSESWYVTASFYQRNYDFGGMTEYDTDWGEMELSFYGFDGMRYLNLSINSPGVSNPWQIENVPIVCYSDVGNYQSQVFAFQIGMPGIPVSGIDYGLTLTINDLFSPPPIMSPAQVNDINYKVYSGLYEDSISAAGSPPLQPAVPLKGKEAGVEIDTTTRALKDFPNQDCGTNECVPAGVSNSLKYLRKAHNMTFDTNFTSIDSAKKAVKWTSRGAETNKWHEYKTEYMEKNKIPITTRKKGADYIPNILTEIDNKQDIEMTIKWNRIGNDTVYYHCVNIVGIKRLGNGKYQITIQDDRDQGVAGGTKNETMEWDSVTNRFTSGTYAGFVVAIHDFIIECPSPPKPTPVTPPNGSTGNPLTTNFGWSDTPTPGTTFSLQVATDLTFELPVFSEDGIFANSFDIPPGFLQPNTEYFWRVRGVDSAGPGPWSDEWSFQTEGNPMTLNLKVFIEGLYNPVLNSMTPDTITVYIRNFFFPFNVYDIGKGVIDNSGNATIIFYNVAEGQNYFLELNHRNALETWSNFPSSFTSGVMNYDFSNSIFKAYGANQKQVDNTPLRFAIYSGDPNQDDVIDGSDQLMVENDAAEFVKGYVATDINGDGSVDGSDMLITENNAANFVGVVRP